jgi:hypothetical protein
VLLFGEVYEVEEEGRVCWVGVCVVGVAWGLRTWLRWCAIPLRNGSVIGSLVDVLDMLLRLESSYIHRMYMLALLSALHALQRPLVLVIRRADKRLVDKLNSELAAEYTAHLLVLIFRV